MTAYQHAEAHERLMDLTLEPEALRQFASTLADSGRPETDDPLVAHVLACATCRDVVASWEGTHDTVRHALAGKSGDDEITLADLAHDDPIAAPATLRSTILERVTAAPFDGPVSTETDRDQGRVTVVPRMMRVRPGRLQLGRQLGRRWLPLVAVLAVVVVAGALVLNESARLDQARRETAALEAVAATVDRVLRDPSHSVVDLRAADGAPAGSISWSSRDFVVLTSALQPPPAGRIYACWIERGGVRSPIGQMWFAGATAYWTGSLEDWATTSFGSGTFGISLEPVNGPRGNPAVLVGDLGG